MALEFRCRLIVFAWLALGGAWLGFGQAAPPMPLPERSPAQVDPQTAGSISGTVVDQSGAVVAGARVRLTRDDGAKSSPANDPVAKNQSSNNQASNNQSSKNQPSNSQSSNNQSSNNHPSSQEVLTGDDGQFSFANVAPGPFVLTVTAAGFAPRNSGGTLQAGEMQSLAQIALGVASTVTEVQVGLTRVEVAEEEIKVEEKQRVLGVIPNFYVTYAADPVPLTSKQKFEIAWKSTVDPVSFVVVGVFAGVEQAQNHFAGYGQGAEGYAKRYGAGYADLVAGTFIGSAILPSILKQDPRYFYKGTGSKRSRVLYAIANSVICKGDNGRWQANYSNILGNLAAGGISNLYYPANDRDGAALTFENAGIGIGATAVANIFQEFVVRKLTPRVSGHQAQP